MGTGVTEIWGRPFLKLRLRLSLETRNQSHVTNLSQNVGCELFFDEVPIGGRYDGEFWCRLCLKFWL